MQPIGDVLHCAAIRPTSGFDVVQISPLLDAFERIGCGAVVFDRSGVVIHANDLAKSVLIADQTDGQAAVRDHLRSYWSPGGTSSHGRVAGAWTFVQRASNRPLALHALQVKADDMSPDKVMVLIVDLDVIPSPKPDTLKRLFGLTTAESSLAIAICRGENLAEIAARRNVSLADGSDAARGNFREDALSSASRFGRVALPDRDPTLNGAKPDGVERRAAPKLSGGPVRTG